MTKDEQKIARDALELALLEAGNQSKLARWCNVSKQALTAWRCAGYVPARHVRSVSEATGVPVNQLRPDLYKPVENRREEYRNS